MNNVVSFDRLQTFVDVSVFEVKVFVELILNPNCSYRLLVNMNDGWYVFPDIKLDQEEKDKIIEEIYDDYANSIISNDRKYDEDR